MPLFFSQYSPFTGNVQFTKFFRAGQQSVNVKERTQVLLFFRYVEFFALYDRIKGRKHVIVQGCPCPCHSNAF